MVKYKSFYDLAKDIANGSYPFTEEDKKEMIRKWTTTDLSSEVIANSLNLPHKDVYNFLMNSGRK